MVLHCKHYNYCVSKSWKVVHLGIQICKVLVDCYYANKQASGIKFSIVEDEGVC